MIHSSMGGAWRRAAARPLARYAVALSLFFIALAVRFQLIGILPERGFPFLSFFPAVLLTTWLVGLWPGMLVAALSTLSAWAFFMGEPVALHRMPHSDLIALVFFAGILVIDCIVIELMNSAMGQLRSTTRKLRRSQDELLAREAELREADRQKDVFLAMLAHELRNPLAPIRSAAQLIAAVHRADDKTGKAAAIIVRQSAQLTRLVDDLLDVSRIHSGKLALRFANVDLREVIKGAVETCQPLAERAAHHVAVALPAVPVPVCVDTVRITQCVSNLLHNAIKFTPEGGRIALAVAVHGDAVTVGISDNGRGIAPEMLPRLFDMFSQEHASGMHGNSGLGIGLALTRHLVERHDGSITATSAGPGQGARFELVLPLATERAAPVAGTPPAQPPRPQLQDAAPTVLVVDDNVDSAHMLQALLEMEGCIVTTAHDGAAALAALAVRRPDVVLLDVGLPDMSGVEVATRARDAGLAGPDMLLVALTGWSDAGSRAASQAAGIAHHLNKPVQLAQLMELMRLHLSQVAPERMAQS